MKTRLAGPSSLMVLRSQFKKVQLRCVASRTIAASLALLVFTSCTSTCFGQKDELPRQMTNGDMEIVEDEKPVGWTYSNLGPMGRKDKRFQVDTSNPFSGKQSLLVDPSESKPDSWTFISHPIDPQDFGGKRIQFKAAVRVAKADDEENHARLCLFAFRLSSAGRRNIVAYDDMGYRPVKKTSWEHHSIVADLPPNVQSLEIGFLVKGNKRAWFDDASLEVVGTEVDVTTTIGISAKGTEGFFTWWLLLPMFACLLFALSQGRAGMVQRFALRFTIIYWLVYWLPGTVAMGAWTAEIIEWIGMQSFNMPVVNLENGSGDTTFNYVRVFSCFCFAIFSAFVWCCLDWRRTDHPWLKDLFRSYLRYATAGVLIGYGFAKLSLDTNLNQFSMPSIGRLSDTYGESSPMGLLWRFMGVSHAYTIFAGLGEVIGGVLLLFRRTTMLGAFVTIGVMTNVVMLNFCYDVPVKQFSSHLLVAALILLIPDFKRLANFFFFNRVCEAATLRPPYVGEKTIWGQRLAKAGLVGIFCWPIVGHVQQELQTKVAPPSYFAEYEVEEFKIDGEVIPEDASPNTRWRSVSFKRIPYQVNADGSNTDWLQIQTEDFNQLGVDLTLSGENNQTLSIEGDPERFPEKFEIEKIDDDSIRMTGKYEKGELEVTLLRKRRDDFELMRRKFRWINEFPHNL